LLKAVKVGAGGLRGRWQEQRRVGVGNLEAVRLLLGRFREKEQAL
jgi:hypothetical protein